MSFTPGAPVGYAISPLAEIEGKDLLKFGAFVRDDKEQSPRSC
jgi:hypothetical protein